MPRISVVTYSLLAAKLPERYRGYLSPEAHDSEALRGMGATCYTNVGYSAALYVVDGDLRGLFALPDAPKGAGSRLAAEVAEAGLVRSLDCFDGHLAKLYATLGWREVGRAAFDPAQAPKEWRAEDGTPDVVFMRYGSE